MQPLRHVASSLKRHFLITEATPGPRRLFFSIAIYVNFRTKRTRINICFNCFRDSGSSQLPGLRLHLSIIELTLSSLAGAQHALLALVRISRASSTSDTTVEDLKPARQDGRPISSRPLR